MFLSENVRRAIPLVQDMLKQLTEADNLRAQMGQTTAEDADVVALVEVLQRSKGIMRLVAMVRNGEARLVGPSKWA
ncbi:MAG TPA: hypothetical protein VGA58_06030, partial [bacterium]